MTDVTCPTANPLTGTWHGTMSQRMVYPEAAYYWALTDFDLLDHERWGALMHG
jgi:hypothetical protein